MSAEYFDALYGADPDPWDLATSEYEREQVRRHRRCARRPAVRARPRDRVLGRGAHRALAPSCDALLAVDAAPRAVAAARARVADLPHVSVERRSVPDGMPDGLLDLIVCSEVLYYWDAATLAEVWERLRSALAPGGSILAVHWRGPVRHYPQGGDAVHALLRDARGDLTVGRTGAWPLFRLDRFDRAAS